MPIMNLRRAIAFPLLAALLAVGGMACIFGGGGNDEAAAEITERLQALEDQDRDNLIAMEVLKADVERVKEANLELTAQVAQLEQDKNAQAALIQGLQGQTAAGGSSAGAGVDYAALSDPDALAMLIDCQVKAEYPGVPDAMLTIPTGMAQSAFQAQLENDPPLITYNDIRGMLPLACGAGQ